MVFALKTTDRIRVNQHAGVARIFTSNNRYLKIGLNGSFVISGQKDIKYLVKILQNLMLKILIYINFYFRTLLTINIQVH